MNKVFCPHCGSPNIDYIESLDLLQCFNCSVIIWDENILNRYKYPPIVKLSQTKINQLLEYPHEEGNY